MIENTVLPTELENIPSQQDPPLIHKLIKRRKQILEDRKTPIVSTGAMVGQDQEASRQAAFDNELKSIDDILTKSGFNPDIAVNTWGNVDTDFDDATLIKFETERRNKPLSTSRQVSASTWHNILRTRINEEKDPDIKRLKEEKLNNLIQTGANLENFNQANLYASNALGVIGELSGGDIKTEREVKKYFEQDLMPVYGKLILKDGSVTGSLEDIPMFLSLQRDKLFNVNSFDQTNQLLNTKFQGEGEGGQWQAPAVAQKQRVLASKESQGLSLLSDAVYQHYEDRLPEIEKYKAWVKENEPRIAQLKTVIADSKINPEEYQAYNNAIKSGEPIRQRIEAFRNNELKEAEALLAKGNLTPEETATVNAINQLGETLRQSQDSWYKNNKEIIDAVEGKLSSSNKDINEYNDLVSQLAQFEGVESDIKNIQGWLDFINNKSRSQKDRYPAVKMDQLMEAEKEWDGESSGAIKRFVFGAAKVAEGMGNFVDIMYNNLFSNDAESFERNYERIGIDKNLYGSAEYNLDKDALYQKPMVWVFDDVVKDGMAAIDSDTNLSAEQKKRMKSQLLERSIDEGTAYRTTNPRAGEVNLTAKSVANTAATFLPQVLGGIGITMATGGGASSLAASTFLTTYSQYYDEAIEKGIKNPNFYATIHAGAEAAVETLGMTDLNTFKGFFQDKKGMLANYFKNISQKDFDKLMAGNKGYSKGLWAPVRSLGEETFEEVGLALPAGNTINNVLFGENVSPMEGFDETLTTTLITMLPLSVLQLPMAGKINIGQKMMLYNSAVDLQKTTAQLKDELDAGRMSEKQYTNAIGLINEYRKAVLDTPTTYADGKPMRDDDRVKFAFNQFISNRQNESKSGIPEDKVAQIDGIIEKAQADNVAIVSNEQSAPELSNIESVETTATPTLEEKKETIKQKFDFVNDEDFVEEAFTPEEDKADRDALPESGIANEQELTELLENGEYAMLTGQNPDAVALSKTANKKLNERATQWLADRGLNAIPIFGKYGNSERSFLVPNMTKAQATEFAQEFQQDSVAHSSGLVYKDGSFNPRTEGVSLEPRFDQGGDFFSTINVGGKKVDFSINYDFDQTIPSDGMQVTPEGDLVGDRLTAAVDMASKALEKTGIKFNIIDSSVDGAGAARENQAIFEAEDGTITIDRSKLASDIEAGIVVWHEAAHPVMNIIRNTNKGLYDAVSRGLQQASAKNAGVADASKWAKANYSKEQLSKRYGREVSEEEAKAVQADESVVETIGRIGEGVIDINNLDTGLRQRIIDFINAIAKKLGIDPILNDTDIAAFKRTAQQVADALRTGTDVSEIVGEDNVSDFQSARRQARIDSEQVAKDTEDRVVESATQPSMVLVGKNKGQDVVLYSGPASIEALRELKPKMYISRAEDLAQTHLVPGKVRSYKSTATQEQKLKWADKVYEQAKATVVSNLNFIFDQIPDSIRNISKLWYDGANIISQELANKYGTTVEQAAAVIATQSPQKPWYDNVHLAHFII